MLKTEYLGYYLDKIVKVPNGYSAHYYTENKKEGIASFGHNPEAACADAQKWIKKAVKG